MYKLNIVGRDEYLFLAFFIFITSFHLGIIHVVIAGMLF